MLKIFYDGQCPLCATEMMHLKKHDHNDLITLVDIHQNDFDTHYPDIKFNDAMKVLHGKYQGKLLLGLEVTHRAWTLVGKGFWVAPLNWPGIRLLSLWVSLGFAKYRLQISEFSSKFLKIKNNNCTAGTCLKKSINMNNRR